MNVPDQRDQHEDEPERRAVRPVAALEEQLLDHLGDRGRARAAEQVGRDEVTDRRNEREDRGRDDPGHRQRQRHVEERLPAARVQVACRPDERRIEPVDRDVQRQDRERQEAVGHPEHDREVGVEQDDRLGREPDRLEDRVHDAVVAQHDHPGVGPDEVAGPERQHHEDQEQTLVAPAVAADPVGQRVADQQRQDRGQRRVAKRVEQGRNEAHVDGPCVVVEGWIAQDDPVQLVAVAKAHHEDQHERHHEERDEPGEPRRQQDPLAKAAEPLGERDAARLRPRRRLGDGGHPGRRVMRNAGSRRVQPPRSVCHRLRYSSRTAWSRSSSSWSLSTIAWSGFTAGSSRIAGSMNSLAAAFGPMYPM